MTSTQSFEVLLALIREQLPGLSRKAPPSTIDATFVEVALLFTNSSAAERSEMIVALAESDGPILLMLGSRATEFALWDSSGTHLEHALTAHCLEDFRADPRDNAVLLSLIWYAAERLNVSARALFSRFAHLASSTGRKHLLEFADRPRTQKTLAAMGFEVLVEKDRPRFQPIPPPWRRSPVPRKSRLRN